MILPTKGIRPDRALITIGGEIIDILREPMTISGLWSTLRDRRSVSSTREVSFDWFVLALDMLFAVGVVRLGSDNFLTRRVR